MTAPWQPLRQRRRRAAHNGEHEVDGFGSADGELQADRLHQRHRPVNSRRMQWTASSRQWARLRARSGGTTVVIHGRAVGGGGSFERVETSMGSMTDLRPRSRDQWPASHPIAMAQQQRDPASSQPPAFIAPSTRRQYTGKSHAYKMMHRSKA
ncbi:hypothetical protein ACLOJK_000643 [Asimina triloba]